MTLPILAPLAGAVQLRPADVDRIAEHRRKCLAACYRAGHAGERREWFGRDQLDAALVAAEEALALKALVGHGNWTQWQREHLHPFGVKPKTMRDWVWVYERRHQIGDAANLTQAKAAIKAAELEDQRNDRRGAGALPGGRNLLIAVDPPWDKANKAGLPYRTMPHVEMLKLPVPARLADDAVVALWVIDEFKRQAHELLDAWGLEFIRTFYWVKDVPSPHGVAMGLCEEMWLARVGKPLLDPGPTTVFYAPRGRHSEKPQEAYDLLERLVPSSPATRLEMFARKRRPDWKVWGDQLPVEEPEARSGSGSVELAAAASPAR